VNIEQQEDELISGYINRYFKNQKDEREMAYTGWCQEFVQGLKSKLLKNILKIKNFVSWQVVLYELQEYSKIEKEVENLYGEVLWMIYLKRTGK